MDPDPARLCQTLLTGLDHRDTTNNYHHLDVLQVGPAGRRYPGLGGRGGGGLPLSPGLLLLRLLHRHGVANLALGVVVVAVSGPAVTII